MKIELQRGPVPLFHQIAEALRYRIATGRLKAGDRLPSIRQAAAEWGVNLHTVRRAYSELASEGLVETRAPNGTHVIDRGYRPPHASARLESFLSRTIETARGDHGLTVERLATLLTNRAGAAPAPPTVHFIECSRAQARGHCQEIEELWRVRALPWSLEDSEEGLPEGDLVATYFHYSEILSAWPDSADRIRFVPIRPDAALADRLPQTDDGPTTLRVCEIDEAKALHIASDLRSMMPDRFRVETFVVARADELLDTKGTSPILLAPRLWGALSSQQRSDPRTFEVRYVIEPDSLQALGRHLDWSPAKKGLS